MQKRRERTKREKRAVATCAAGTAVAAIGYALAGVSIADGTSIFLAGATAGLNIAVIVIATQILREERAACIQH